MATAATHTAIENQEAALEGIQLSWSDLMAEAAKAGGTAFLEVFILTKFSPYLRAKFPRDLGARISDEQLASLSRRLGHTISRTQLVEALSSATAEVWSNVLSSGSATCFELTFDLLRAKNEMSLGEFVSSLVTNVLTAGGLHLLVGALAHARMRWNPFRGTPPNQPSSDLPNGPAKHRFVPHLHPPLDHHSHRGQSVPSERNHKPPGTPSIEDVAEPLASACGSAPSAKTGAGSSARNRTAGALSEQAFVASGSCGETRIVDR